jgi:hypothetical protein
MSDQNRTTSPDDVFGDLGWERRKHNDPIADNDAIVTIWENGLEEAIMRFVQGSCPHWVAVDVLRRGNNSPPTPNPVEIVVTVTIFGAIEERLNQVREMRSICAKHGRPDVESQIRQGRVERWGPRSPEAVILDTPYPEKRPFAASVGLPTCGSGTLGGFVLLSWEATDGGEARTVVAGMTCHHVVEPKGEQAKG